MPVVPRIPVLVAAAAAAACMACADVSIPDAIHIPNAGEWPDWDRIPRFYTSDPAYDEFVNDYFIRHLSIDDRAVYFGGVQLGIVDHMWVIEWDIWMLPWIDRGAMGLRRQGNSPVDVIRTTLLHVPVDKYGYTWGARLIPENRDVIGGHIPTFGWPWPKYNRNYAVDRPTGWEFNDPNDPSRDEWQARDIALEPGCVDHGLQGTITGSDPELVSPAFDVDVSQVPIVEIDITYRTASGRGANRLVDGFRLYWTTDAASEFGEDRMVTTDFAHLPPKDFPREYSPYVSGSEARYPLYFPMCLHPGWGREGRRITGLKIVPAGRRSQGVTVLLNYARASYDVRLTTTNTTLINGVYRLYMWSGDTDYLRVMMPRLRRAMMYLNEHMGGRRYALINTQWLVGRDGIGGDQPGQGIYGSYWDLLPGGRLDFESSIQYHYALNAMAALEEAAARRGVEVPEVSVIGPDNRTIIRWSDTPRSLRALARRVKREVEKQFWVEDTLRFCRNVDVNGDRHDYGFLHFNVLALAFGIGTPQQRDHIVSWLEGREIPGDTSVGPDIYHWRFAPRTSTRRNTGYYYWAWIVDARRDGPDSSYAYSRQWGNQLQDGGAAPFTSLFDLMARTSTGRQEQIDKAFQRTREIQAWHNDVRAAGGKGRDFYRAYYDGHPERGYQQSPMPGGLGLDREFLSDSSLGTIFLLYAFLRVDAVEDGVLSIAPAVPSQVDRIGVANVYYRGNHLNIEAGRGYVSLEGSRIPLDDGLKAKITLRNVAERSIPTVDGVPAVGCERRGNSVTLVTDLKPVRVEYRLASEE